MRQFRPPLDCITPPLSARQLTLHHGLDILLDVRMQASLVWRQRRRPRPVGQALVGPQSSSVRLIASAGLGNLGLRNHVQGLPELGVQLVILVILLDGSCKIG